MLAKDCPCNTPARRCRSQATARDPAAHHRSVWLGAPLDITSKAARNAVWDPEAVQPCILPHLEVYNTGEKNQKRALALGDTRLCAPQPLVKRFGHCVLNPLHHGRGGVLGENIRFLTHLHRKLGDRMRSRTPNARVFHSVC